MQTEARNLTEDEHKRYYALTHKNMDGSISDEEKSELERLQAIICEWYEQAERGDD